MSKKYNIVALLPMKLHSERIKGKNFKLFAGKPLFLWILDSLLAVDTIDKIVINTDARDLLKQNGIIENDRILIRDRKAELCGDKISMNWVLSDDIENVDSNLYLMRFIESCFENAKPEKNMGIVSIKGVKIFWVIELKIP